MNGISGVAHMYTAPDETIKRTANVNNAKF